MHAVYEHPNTPQWNLHSTQIEISSSTKEKGHAKYLKRGQPCTRDWSQCEMCPFLEVPPVDPQTKMKVWLVKEYMTPKFPVWIVVSVTTSCHHAWLHLGENEGGWWVDHPLPHSWFQVSWGNDRARSSHWLLVNWLKQNQKQNLPQQTCNPQLATVMKDPT